MYIKQEKLHALLPYRLCPFNIPHVCEHCLDEVSHHPCQPVSQLNRHGIVYPHRMHCMFWGEKTWKYLLDTVVFETASAYPVWCEEVELSHTVS